jgi:hypothetical protein
MVTSLICIDLQEMQFVYHAIDQYSCTPKAKFGELACVTRVSQDLA